MNRQHVCALLNEAATLRLGEHLALCLCEPDSPRFVLLFGPLGAGKTCLVRGLVSRLPGGDVAEVASPSFSLCNLYPTIPPVAHVDLYRTGMAMKCLPNDVSCLPLTDEVLELVDNNERLVIVEWGEFYPTDCMPEKRLDVVWQQREVSRQVELTLHGSFGVSFFNAWQHVLSAFDETVS